MQQYRQQPLTGTSPMSTGKRHGERRWGVCIQCNSIHHNDKRNQAICKDMDGSRGYSAGESTSEKDKYHHKVSHRCSLKNRINEQANQPTRTRLLTLQREMLIRFSPNTRSCAQSNTFICVPVDLSLKNPLT